MKKIRFFLASLLVACLSVGFASCNSSDDDDNKGGSGSDASIVGTWSIDDKASSSVATVDGKAASLSEFGVSEDELSVIKGDVVFNGDGTFSFLNEEDPISGKYSVSGSQLTFEYTEDGQKIIVKKGADLSNVLLDDEEAMDGMTMKVDDNSYSLDGDKLTITTKMIVKFAFDPSEMGGDLGLDLGGFGDLMNKEIVVTSKSVFNKKK